MLATAAGAVHVLTESIGLSVERATAALVLLLDALEEHAARKQRRGHRCR